MTSPATINPDAHPEATSFDGNTYPNLTDSQTWAQKRGTNPVSAINDTNTLAEFADIMCGSVNNWQHMMRSIFLFDTSALGASAMILSAVFSVYVTAKRVTLANQSVALVATNPASNTAITNTDFATFGSTALATAIPLASINTNAYNDFTLNAAGLAAIAKTGITKLGLMIDSDRANAEPAFSANACAGIDGNYADNGSNKPKLVITFYNAGGFFLMNFA